MSGEAWEQRPRKRGKRKKQADYSKQMIADIRSPLWVVTVGGLLASYKPGTCQKTVRPFKAQLVPAPVPASKC